MRSDRNPGEGVRRVPPGRGSAPGEGRPGWFTPSLVLAALLWGAVPALSQSHTIHLAELEELREFFRYHPGSPPLIVAHRGGAYPGLPENSLAVFEYTLAHTHAIIETDFRLTRDNRIVMMHDGTLDRTTTGTGVVEEHTLDAMRALPLVDHQGTVTAHRTSSLQEVLAWAEERTIIAVDVKAPLTFQRMIDEIVIAGAEARVFIQTYNLEDALSVHRAHPGLMMSTSLRNLDDLAALEASGIPLENVIAHTGSREPEDPALYDHLRERRMYTMVGTLGGMDREAAAGNPGIYRSLLANGATIISTDRPVEVAQAIAGMLDPDRFSQEPFGASGRK